ncbi:MAG: prolyl oligopeptidase family serine peptidase, partial [Gammaproteobacteria bacterium]|nr:prolyl oligopeptidase family serine peptidase [Gammaproteobacteria bacterium]
DALFAEGSIDDERLRVYGFSRGGQLALLLAAIDARACATAVGSWFCQRLAKLLDTNDQRLACYLDSPEDEQFVPGWLTCFTDAELAALGAPEPLLVTHGLDDPVTPYEHVETAFAPVAALYDALGFGHLARLHLHPGGHAPAVAATLAFFAEWLALPALDLPAPRPTTLSRAAPGSASRPRRGGGGRGAPGAGDEPAFRALDDRLPRPDRLPPSGARGGTAGG